jgi:hypothetical protein
MNQAKDLDQQTTQGDGDAKPTMQDLWLRHPEIQNAAMIEAPGIPYLRVVYAFCGYPVTQQEFDTVLKALNQLTSRHYTQDDIAGVYITPDKDDSL